MERARAGGREHRKQVAGKHRPREVPGTSLGLSTPRAGAGAAAGAEASAESVAATNTTRARVVGIWGG